MAAAAERRPNTVQETSFVIPFSQRQVEVSQNSFRVTETTALVLLSHKVTTVYQAQPHVIIAIDPMGRPNADAAEPQPAQRADDAKGDDVNISDSDSEDEGEPILRQRLPVEQMEEGPVVDDSDDDLPANGAARKYPCENITAVAITVIGGVVTILGLASRCSISAAAAGISYLGNLIGR